MSLRRRKREQTHDELVARARELFAARGFDATSADEIAAAAGVSRRTFFRYFDTKEAVFLAPQVRRMRRFADMLSAAEPGGGSYAAVRGVFLDFAVLYMAERERVVADRAVLDGSRTLLVAELALDARWERIVADHLAQGVDSDGQLRRANVLAGAIMGMARAVLRDWYASDGAHDLAQAARAGFELLENGPLGWPGQPPTHR